MKRVFLLGGTGFIGSSVLTQLRSRTDLRFMMLGHSRVNYRELEDVDLVVGSLTSFDLSWIDVFQPDTILHLARLSGRGALGRRWAAERGGLANRRLIAKLRQLATPPHVVYVSGTLVYGDCGEGWADERSPVTPIAYARQYIIAERPWMAAQANGDLPVTLLRPPWVIGADSWFAGYYAGTLSRDGVVPCYGAGANWMTFLDVDDCAGLILHVAETAAPGACYNLFAPGQYARQRDFAAAVAAEAGTQVSFIDGGAMARRLERGAGEALVTSLRARTIHDSVLKAYPFRHPLWEVSMKRHLSAYRGANRRTSLVASRT